MGEPTLQTPIGIATLKPRSLVSALIGRFQFLQRAGLTFGGKRDLYEAFGYARELTLKDFRDRYSRDGIAARLIDCYPKATWREGAYLQEDEDPEKTTPFEQAWEDFDKRLGIWSMFERVDKLARLSAYSILLIGTPDGNLEEELPKGKSLDQIIFLSAFAGGGGPGRTGEAMYVDATIQEFVRDPTDPRFGLPSAYQLSRVDATAPAMQRIVHWSRIIHVAEGLLDNDVFGTPQLLDVWNRFDDLDKVTGGGAEAFFQRANKGLNLNLDKDVEMQEEDRKKLASEVDDYVHGMTRILKTRAMTVQELGSDVANFSQPADAIITQIAGAKGIPKRILLGSEMGQLASGQDRDNWDTQVKDRRTSYAGPRLVRPFVDRLIEYGYLPTPKEYIVVWPEVSNLTEAEKADGANKWANTNSTAGVTIFTPEEIRDHWYQMDPLTPEQLEAAKAQKDAEAPPEPVVMDPMGKLVKPKPGMGKPPFMGGKKPADGKKPAFGRRAAEEGEEIDPLDTLVDSLEAALEAGDMDFVSSCLGIHALGGPGSGDKEGHPFRGNQYTDVGMQWTKNEAGNWVDERGREQWADKSGPPKSPEYMFHLMKANLSQANHRNAAFILPDGTMLAKRHRSQPHFSAAEEAGVHFSALLKAGVVRVAEPGAAEVSVPITEIQAQLLIDSALYAQGSPRAGTLFGRPGELYIDVDLTGAGPGSGRHATKVFDPERTTADALRAWISHQFAEHEERRQPYRAAGGPGSGDKEGHDFHGNQWVDKSGRAIRGPLQRLVAEASEGRLSEYELRRELAEELERDKHGLVGRSIDWPTQPKPPSAGSLEWKIQGLLRDHAAGLVDNAELRHEIKRLIGEPGWTSRGAGGPGSGDLEGHPFRGNQWTKGSIPDRMNRILKHAEYWSNTRWLLPDGTRLSHAAVTHTDAAKRLGTTLPDVLRAGVIRVSAPGSFEIGAPITEEMAKILLESMASPQSTVGLHIDIAGDDNRYMYAHSRSFDSERTTPEGLVRWVNGFYKHMNRAAQEPIEEIKALEARGDAVLLFATTDREAADAHAYGREGTAIFEFDVPDDTDLAALEEDLGMRIYVVGEARGLGGPGSGHFGHAGRPGHVGGSSKGTGPTQDEIDAEILAKGSSGFPPKDPWGKDTQMMYSDGHGNYTPERQALHDAIVRKILKGTTPVDDPSAWFVGGGMAAGKSTLTNTLTWDNTVMVNPDVIRDQLPEWQETLAAALSKGEQNASVSFTHEEASDISREVIQVARRESRNMMLDAVGDSSFERLAEKIAMMGPNVDAIYVTVPIALAQQRADHRARTTDRRFVLPEFMAAAHAMVSKIYPKAVAGGVFRSTQLFETSIQGYPKWIASSKGKELTIFDHDLWDEFIAKGGKG